MPSRDRILAAVRRNHPSPTDLPSLDEDWIAYPDVRAAFVEVVNGVGGTVVVAPDRDAGRQHLSALKPYTSATSICSLVEGFGDSKVDWDSVSDGRELKDVDFAVVPGQFGVAENGAIWLTDTEIRHRALVFLAQHLAIVLKAEALVPHMHAAYTRLEQTGQSASQPGFGVFLSGPSKTADIEQSLVIGAHGARSLTVYLVEDL